MAKGTREIGSLFVGLGLSSENFVKSIQKIEKDLNKFGSKVNKLGLELSKNLSIPAGVVTAGTAFLTKKYDDALSKIKRKTGETGKEFVKLQGSFDDVFRNGDDSMEDVASALVMVSQKSGLTGKSLEDLTATTLDLVDLTGADLNTVVNSSIDLFKKWKISVDQQIPSLDLLYKIATTAGIEFSILAESLSTNGVILQAFGYSLQESASLLALFAKNGTDVDIILKSMQKAYASFLDAGVNPRIAFNDLINQIQKLDEVQGNNLAQQAVGSKGFLVFADAVRRGSFNLSDFSNKLGDSTNAISVMAIASQTWGQKFQQLWNPISSLVAKTGESLFKNLKPALDSVIALVKTLSGSLSDNKISSSFLQISLAIVTITSVIGPLIIGFGNLLIALSKIWATVTILGSGLMTLLWGPVGAVTAAVVVGTIAWVNYKDTIIDIWNTIQRTIARSVEGVANSINFLSNLLGNLKRLGLGVVSPGTISAVYETNKLKSAQELKERLEIIDKQFPKANDNAKKTSESFTEQLKKNYEEVSKVGLATSTTSKNVFDFNEVLGKGSKKLSDAEKEAEKYADSFKNLSETLDLFIDTGNGLDSISDKTKLLFQQFQYGEITGLDFKEQILEIAKTAGLTSEQIDTLKNSISKMNDEMERRKNAKDSLFGNLFGRDINGQARDPIGDLLGIDLKGIGNQLMTSLGDTFGLDGQQLEGLGSDLANALSDSITKAFDNILNGGSWDKTVESFGESIGGALGSVFGPAGSFVGKIVGAKYGRDISKFGESTTGTARAVGTIMWGPIGGEAYASIAKALGSGLSKNEKIRRAFGNSFNELVKASGQAFENLGKDNKLETSLDLIETKFSKTAGKIEDKVNSLNLTDKMKEDFDGLGTTLNALFGNLADGAKGLVNEFGQLLALNFRDANGLNDLQLILQGAGYDAEKLGKVIEDAFLKGDLSARKFLEANNAIQDIMSQGIPGAIGATLLAFQNIGDKALQSGAKAKDAYGDLAAEGIEANIESLEALKANLIANGGDIKQLDILFQQFAANGIKTVEQLKNISTIDAAKLTVGLQDAGYQFAEWGKGLDNVTNKLTSIENFKFNSKVMEIQIKTTGEKDLVKDGGLNIDENISSSVDVENPLNTNGISKRLANSGSLMGEYSSNQFSTTASRGFTNTTARKGKINSGLTINIDAKNSEAGVEQKIERVLTEFADSFGQSLINKVQDMNDRGTL